MRHRLALAALVLCLAWPARAATELEYLDSGQWTFNQDVAVNGNLVAATLSYGVQLWDVTNAAAPVFLADYYTDGYRAWAVAWEGDLVAVTTNVGHLYLLDVSDPAHPGRVDRISGVGSNTDLAFRREDGTRWLYSAGNASQDFQIRDLTTPANSVLHGTLPLDGTPNGIVLLGDVALVSARAVGLYAVDISDHDNPVLLDTEAVPGTHIGAAADGTRAALASGTSGFTLFDVSNPANPVKHATVIPAAGVWSNLQVQEVAVSGTTLYAICRDVGVLTYNISNLDAPHLTGYDPRLDITPPSPIYYVFGEGVVVGNRLYLSHWSGINPGVVMIDASSSTETYLGRTLGFDYVRDVDADAGFVYGCTGQMGIFAHEQVSPYELVPRGQLHIVETWGVQAHGSTVYIASTIEGIVVGDFSDPDNPVELGSLAVGQARQLTVKNGVAYVAAFTQGFHTVDVSDPNNLVGLDSAVHAGQASVNVDVVDGLAVTADQADGMNVWDVSDPANIQQLANWPTSNQADDVLLSPDGELAYLVVRGVGVQVIDLSTPSSPSLLNTFGNADATGVSLLDGFLTVSAGTSGVTTYHQGASPIAPVELASFNTAHDAKALCTEWDGNDTLIYVADYSALVALRMNPSTPVAVSSFALTAQGAGVQVDWMLAEAADAENLRLSVAPAAGGPEIDLPFSALDNGLAWQARDTRTELAGHAWRYNLYGRDPGDVDWQLMRSDTVKVPGTAPAPVVLRNYPNPFNPSTTLSFDLEAASRARLLVFDAQGRQLALLHDGPLAAGPARFTWDGHDDTGHALPSGTYFARLVLPGQSRDTKLVLIK